MIPLINLRAALEDAVERAIEALDAYDGDPDIEQQCEDEGVDTDSEPDVFHEVPDYGINQTLVPDSRGILTAAGVR